MLPHARGSIFTGATASERGDDGYTAFTSAKFGRRVAVQSITRELSPRSIHVAHLVIDEGVATGWVRQRITAAGSLASIAETYWQLHRQLRQCVDPRTRSAA
jgi:hypothetical protein